MRYLKKALSLFLVFLMVLSFSGCGVFGSRLAAAAMKMQKLQSLRMDIEADLDMNMNMFGESVDLDMLVNGPVDLICSPLKSKADLTANMMGDTLDILCYAENTGNRFKAYCSTDGGKNWTKTESDLSDLSSGISFDAKSIAGLLKLASAFEEKGTETVRGSEAVVYSGEIPIADLMNTVDPVTVLESIEQSASIELDESALDFSSAPPVPLTLCIDKKSNMLVKCSVDLTGLMQTMLPVLTQAAIQSAMQESGLGNIGGLGLSLLGFELNVSKLVASAVLYDFDAVGEIVIPPEALSAVTVNT